jgi:hypothetical protein
MSYYRIDFIKRGVLQPQLQFIIKEAKLALDCRSTFLRGLTATFYPRDCYEPPRTPT